MQEGSSTHNNPPQKKIATTNRVVISAKQSLLQTTSIVTMSKNVGQQRAYLNPHIPASAFTPDKPIETRCTLISVSGKVFAIPQGNIAKYMRIPAATVANRFETLWTENGRPITVFNHHNDLLPVVRLATILGMPLTYTHPTTGSTHEERRQNIWERRQLMQHPEVDEHTDGRPYLPRIDEDRRETPYPDTELVVVTLPGPTTTPQQFGIAVESIGPQKTVTVHPAKQGDSASHTPQAFDGTTLVGNGVVAKILNIEALAALGYLNFDNIKAEEQRRKKVIEDANIMLAKFPQWEPPAEEAE